MHQFIKFTYFGITLHMFRRVFPSIIRSSRLYIQQQTDIALCLLAYLLASRKQYLVDKCLLLYVWSWTPDDGRKDRPKHVECHSKINKFNTLMYLVGFTMGIILRCMALWKSKTDSDILLSSDTTLFIFSYLWLKISKLLSFYLSVRRNYSRSVRNRPCLTLLLLSTTLQLLVQSFGLPNHFLPSSSILDKGLPILHF